MNEIILAIQSILKDTLRTQYKKYFYGEVRVPEQAFMPFLEVVPMSSKITNRGTGGMLSEEYSVAVSIKTTIKKFVGQKLTKEIMDHIQDCILRMEGRNDDGTLKSDSVIGVLHDNLQLTISETRKADIVGDWDVSYEESDLGESYIVVATVMFNVKRMD